MEESLRSEVLELKLKELTVIVEEHKQTSHEMKLKVTAARLIRDEAMSEASSLQESLTKAQTQCTELTLKKNKEISMLHKQSNDKTEALLQHFEDEKSKYEEQIASLREQLSTFQNQNTSELNSTSVIEEILELKNKNLDLRKCVDMLKEKLSLTENDRLVLNHKYDAANKELDMAMDNLTAKKEELNSANANMTALQEELVMLRVELDGAKMLQNPLERGNSLFGEVDDYRKRLQSRLDSAIQTNKQLKRQLAINCKEVSKLKAEKVFLCSEIKSVEEGCKKFDNLHVESYKIRIQELQGRVEELERLKLPQVRVLLGDKGEDLSWVENLVEGERAETRKLRAALEEKSVAQLIESDSLHRVQRELQVVKAQLMEARAHNIALQLEAQEGGSASSERKLEPEIRTQTNAAEQDNKENVGAFSNVKSVVKVGSVNGTPAPDVDCKPYRRVNLDVNEEVNVVKRDCKPARTFKSCPPVFIPSCRKT